MVNYFLLAFAIIHITLFCVMFLVYGTGMRASIAAYRAYIFSLQGTGLIAGLIGMRYLIGLLYL